MAVDPKGNTGAGMEDFTGQKGVSKLIETGSKGMGAWLKQFKELLTTAEKLNKVVKNTADIQSGKKSSGGGSTLGGRVLHLGLAVVEQRKESLLQQLLIRRRGRVRRIRGWHPLAHPRCHRDIW